MVIVDTSVALKWFLQEEGAESAQALLQKEILGAPDLLLYEFTNVLTCQPALKSEDVQKFLKLLYQFQIQYFVLSQDRFIRVAKLCQKFSITAYDASFIVLAESLRADFITADEKLVRKVKSLPFVQRLS
jgi:predicted nucleic acid-binding protein